MLLDRLKGPLREGFEKKIEQKPAEEAYPSTAQPPSMVPTEAGRKCPLRRFGGPGEDLGEKRRIRGGCLWKEKANGQGRKGREERLDQAPLEPCKHFAVREPEKGIRRKSNRGGDVLREKGSRRGANPKTKCIRSGQTT